LNASMCESRHNAAAKALAAVETRISRPRS
jgi:hypothetical protein